MEKRKSVRLVKSIPVRISIPDLTLNGNPSSRIYEVIGHNISEGGIFIETIVPDKTFVANLCSKLYKVLEIRLAEKDVIIETVAELVWFKEMVRLIEDKIGWGMKFVEMSYKGKNNLMSYISEFNKEKKAVQLEKFTLLIDGKDVDTGIYEYFPYADKTILDYKTTYRAIRQLKKGEKPEKYEDYIAAKYCLGKEDTNQKAIESAYRASKVFKKLSLEIRRKIAGDIHDLLVAHRDRLIELLVTEGHPVKLAEWEFSGMEMGYRKETLDFYMAGLWRRIEEGNEVIHITRKPDGVVCLSPPRNASCSNSLLASLVFLTGNTLIVKPPLRMPISTIYLWKNVVNEALRKNGAPEGTLNIVLGNSKKILEEWLASPYVSDIVYFGDSEMGLEIGARTYLAGKKAILELSGNDMFFVWKDADIDKAVVSLLDCFMGSTQICMVPKQAMIHQDIYDEFKENFLKEVKKLKMGLPSDQETCLVPVIKSKEFFESLEDALNKGGILIQGGKRTDHKGKPRENGVYIEPTVIQIDDEKKASTMKVIQEENFFPLLPLVRVTGKDDDEIFSKMVALSNFNEYGLRTSLWITSRYYTKRFINEIGNTGLFRINARHIGFSLYAATHGGTGKTGGPYGEMNYIWQKATHLQGITLKEDKEQF